MYYPRPNSKRPAPRAFKWKGARPPEGENPVYIYIYINKYEILKLKKASVFIAKGPGAATARHPSRTRTSPLRAR